MARHRNGAHRAALDTLFDAIEAECLVRTGAGRSRWPARLSPAARKRLAEIGRYLAGVGGRGASSAFLARIKGCASLLGRPPRLGRARDGDLGPGRRGLVCGGHILIRRTEGRAAAVRRVIGGRRDGPALLPAP